MDHLDHVALLRDGVAGRVWADLGAGDGAFTLALADLLGAGAEIHAVDRDRGALDRLEDRMRTRFPQLTLQLHAADFTVSLALPPLDGIVMANSLHFVRDKVPLLERLRARLKPDGRFLLVEYDSDRGNRWVPHPLPFATWREVAARAGFVDTRFLHAVPSRFLERIYSAASRAPAEMRES